MQDERDEVRELLSELPTTTLEDDVTEETGDTKINEESISKLTFPPNKRIVKSKKKLINPEYEKWMTNNKQEWNDSIDYILSIEPEFKMKVTQKRPNKEWSA